MCEYLVWFCLFDCVVDCVGVVVVDYFCWCGVCGVVGWWGVVVWLCIVDWVGLVVVDCGVVDVCVFGWYVYFDWCVGD